VTTGHVTGGEAGYRGHAIKGIGQHLVTLCAHRWCVVEPGDAEEVWTAARLILVS
jgi:hypothetical protein